MQNFIPDVSSRMGSESEMVEKRAAAFARLQSHESLAPHQKSPRASKSSVSSSRIPITLPKRIYRLRSFILLLTACGPLT